MKSRFKNFTDYKALAIFLVAALLIFYAIYSYGPQQTVSTDSSFKDYGFGQKSSGTVEIDSNLQKDHFNKMKQSRLQSMREATAKGNLAYFQMYIVPQLLCPTAVRVGRVGDGGKWVCNPWRVPDENCVVYSFGIFNDTSFENDLNEVTAGRCRFYCVDADEEPSYLFEGFNGTFLQSYIGGYTNETDNGISLADFMLKYNHRKVDILKMDIEGSEFAALNAFFNDSSVDEHNTMACQLMVELHLFKGDNVEIWLNLFQQLERRGFYMFSKEANMRCPRCYEFSYLHKSCFSQYGVTEKAVLFTYFVG